MAAECRHHRECFIVHVWEGLVVEESTGPEITVFQRFRKHQFELRYSEVEDLHFFELTELRDDVVGLLKSVLADKTFAYR